MTSGIVVAASGLICILGAMTVLWTVSLRLRDASIADPFWGPGFALVMGTYLLVDGAYTPRGLLVFALVVVWAARLGIHLLARNRKSGEDPRYAAMRERAGDRFAISSLFRVFWLQGVLLWIISAPLFAAVRSGGTLTAWDATGVLIFVAGLTIEAVADAHLARFKADPASRGRVLDTGLWRLSRHPNYFGETVLWWGLFVPALGAHAYWAVVGPLLITFLLLRVSGVTLLEEGLRATKPGYADYVRRTSAFVPWPPRSMAE